METLFFIVLILLWVIDKLFDLFDEWLMGELLYWYTLHLGESVMEVYEEVL